MLAPRTLHFGCLVWLSWKNDPAGSFERRLLVLRAHLGLQANHVMAFLASFRRRNYKPCGSQVNSRPKSVLTEMVN